MEMLEVILKLLYGNDCLHAWVCWADAFYMSDLAQLFIGSIDPHTENTLIVIVSAAASCHSWSI